MNPQRIILSRTDSIGDVILTLPMAGVLKQYFPNSTIIFLGRTYTQPIVSKSKYVDEFANWDEISRSKNPLKALKEINADTIIHVFPNEEIARLARKAKITNRIGTGRRIYHLLNCNKKVFFSRRKSDLHEAQLNLKLLIPLGINQSYTVEELANFYGVENLQPLREELQNKLGKKNFNLILHPKSKGSAKEWGLNNFNRLIDLLPEDKFQIFITGTKEEGILIGDVLPFQKENVTSLIGQLSLDELISFIAAADGLIAASTGPLHIAALTGINAIGLYSPKKPIHPGRWKPIGKKAIAMVKDPRCLKCAEGKECDCISEIDAQAVYSKLKSIHPF